MFRFTPLLILLVAGQAPAAATFTSGDSAYLCLEQALTNWPEKFAVKVKILGLKRQRYKIEVVDTFTPATGRTNEESTLAIGDILTFSATRLYTREQAGIRPGARFEGKPVCAHLMQRRP